jgi:acetyltransferase-like isoleucine patch superfamily enzyme
MVNTLKKAFKFLYFKFRRLNIAYSANVDLHSPMGQGVEIGPKATLSASTLHDCVTLSENAIVSGSELGSYSKIFKNTRIQNAGIGRCTYVAEDSIIDNTSIGAFCSIGPRVLMGYGEHPTDFISTSPIFYSNARQTNLSLTSQNAFPESNRISIGNDVWIGAMAFIRNGVTIGDGAIVAAGAIVVSDVPAYAIYGGVPAKLIRKRFTDETSAYLQELQWWHWDIDRLKGKLPLFQQQVRHVDDLPAIARQAASAANDQTASTRND